MTPRQPDPSPGVEPERGFILAVLAQGVDADDELADEGHEVGLVPALRREVDELQGSGGEVGDRHGSRHNDYR